MSMAPHHDGSGFSDNFVMGSDRDERSKRRQHARIRASFRQRPDLGALFERVIVPRRTAGDGSGPFQELISNSLGSGNGTISLCDSPSHLDAQWLTFNKPTSR